MTATIKATELAAMLRTIAPHMSSDDYLPVLAAIQIESRGGHLFAAATDRYTLAVRRADNCGSAKDWTALVAATDITTIRSWLKPWDAEPIELVISDVDPNRSTTQTLTLYGQGRRLSLTVPADAGRIQHAPNWRKILRGILERELSAVAVTYKTEYLSRWCKAGDHISMWQTGVDKPLIIIGENLLGAQMPILNPAPKPGPESDIWRGLLTRTRAEVDGVSYGLTQKWRDNDGDLWVYSGDDNADGEPLMRLDEAADLDQYTLAHLINEYGPLTATGLPA